MKKKLVIVNYSLLLAVLFAILFQSFHSFEHLPKQLSTQHCDHKYDRSQAQISHSHHDFDDCFVCEYSFSNYIPTDFFTFSFNKAVQNSSYSFAITEKPIVFSGSLSALRGPPSFIV